ncbi:hypothetical protein COCSUDRAFT_34560 [Coccomyxa subellipsoidea C-169]|uniref:Uncharacterized protein n=1 Tax=Coccomyxa subellipsoidea (strain C-169) TaxID=574566 RepID=I0YJ32_COCSC|nr:hypothetical protein COCSUDRAFT_34560 [Coccomyxa subellipsoidea C-169]EIE18401.1 hypothetical protein COCSUDRAFT_34560 [Coccomyxa subellipsoidea C-169]|eukprot:XP_005642945.1 hypothetical protein COCSUDRAFT_34560 [Coccomyxa subellipsoidea C-169]
MAVVLLNQALEKRKRWARNKDACFIALSLNLVTSFLSAVNDGQYIVGSGCDWARQLEAPKILQNCRMWRLETTVDQSMQYWCVFIQNYTLLICLCI